MKRSRDTRISNKVEATPRPKGKPVRLPLATERELFNFAKVMNDRRVHAPKHPVR